MSYGSVNKIQAAMIALEQEEVLDWIGWYSFFKALQHFGYGPEIIQKIKKVYRNIETQIKVNGYKSQAFLVKRGLWQRCPLSVILYIIFQKYF